MIQKKQINTPLKISIYMAKWLLITGIIGVFTGTITAFFLKSLIKVTDVRLQHTWLLFLLPVSGALFAFLYERYGENAIRGNNLVIDQANGQEETIPLRMIPLVLFGTIATHLFGGSVGREGTAVQIGGTIAEHVGKRFYLKSYEREIIIISGISAGFSAVFGTPLAGTLFGLEVLAVTKIRGEAIFPSFFAAFFANYVTELWGVTHTRYSMGSLPDLSFMLFLKLFIAGSCFGVIGWLFSRSIVWIKKGYSLLIKNSVFRNFIGGAVVVLLAVLLQSQRYLGLSLPLLSDSFAGNARAFDFIGKLLFTVLSLGAGFQGGEVTPLFEIGASLGSSLGGLLHISVPFLAGLGFIGVFSGATNTPIACFVMGIELFGGEAALYFFLICLISYMCSGNAGIYSAQEIGEGKASFEFTLFPLKKRRKE